MRALRSDQDYRERGARRRGSSRPGGVEALAGDEGHLGAHAQRGERRVHVGASNGLRFIRTAGQKIGEAADKRISRTGGVHGVHRVGRNVLEAAAARRQGAVLAQRQDHVRNAVFHQPEGAGAGFLQVAHRQAAEPFRLGFIGDQVIGVGDFAKIERLGRRRIEQRANSLPPRQPQRVINGFERYFELQHDAIGLAQQIGGRIDIAGQQAVVGALHDQNAVLAGAIDENRRYAAGRSGRDRDMRGIDSAGAEVFDRGGAEQVVAHPRHHGHPRTASPRGHGLVCAFAAKPQLETASEDGFPGRGKPSVKVVRSTLALPTTTICGEEFIKWLPSL